MADTAGVLSSLGSIGFWSTSSAGKQYLLLSLIRLFFLLREDELAVSVLKSRPDLRYLLLRNFAVDQLEALQIALASQNLDQSVHRILLPSEPCVLEGPRLVVLATAQVNILECE